MLINTIDNVSDLKDELKPLYDEINGKYELKQEYRAEDISPLKNALERVKEEKLQIQKNIDLMKEKEQENEIKLAEASGDKEKLKKLNQDRIDEQKSAHDSELESLRKMNHDLTVGSAVTRIASSVYEDYSILDLSDMKKKIIMNDDKNGVTFLNGLGEKITESEFIEEMKKDKRFSKHIIASKASGGADDNVRENMHGSKAGYASMTSEQKRERIRASIARRGK